jgi:hypothetical protein
MSSFFTFKTLSIALFLTLFLQLKPHLDHFVVNLMAYHSDDDGNDYAHDFANELLLSWSSSLLEWTTSNSETADEVKHHKDAQDPAQLSPGTQVIVRIVVSDVFEASFRTLLGSGWEEEMSVTVTDSRSKGRLPGYSQIDDDDNDDNENNGGDTEHSDLHSDPRGRQKNVLNRVKDKCIYVTGNIVSCDWRHPKVCSLPLIYTF